MKSYTNEELNQASMQIILHAGNGRDFVNQALSSLAEKRDCKEYNELMKKAHEEITMAHKAQTEIIQSTVLEEKQNITLLFIHAQDTLMTISSEFNISKQIGLLYGSLLKGSE